jgi:hypothetical protein
MKALLTLTVLSLLSLPVATPVQALSAPTLMNADYMGSFDRRSGHCHKRAAREGSICGGV